MNILINCDLGEKDTIEELESELGLLPYIDMANIACGGHAGSDEVMQNMMTACRNQGVKIGAHPSYPDKARFGRVSLVSNVETLQEWLSDQLNTFRSIAISSGIQIHHLKPHGALYHDAGQNPEIAQIVVDVTMRYLGNGKIVGPADSHLESIAIRSGLAFLAEAFADRRYTPSLALQSRTTPGSVLTPDQATAQVRQMTTLGTVPTSAGPKEIRFDTLCVHSDSPGALHILQSIRNIITH